MALYISADHVDQKATCTVSYPALFFFLLPLPFLPSCSHLRKHYCVEEFNFCFTGISGSCVIPSLARSICPGYLFPLFRFFRYFKRCFGLFITQVTSQRNENSGN